MGEAKQRRGFAGMTAEQRARISSMGGKAAHALGRAHQWSPEEAKAAGSKGGRARHANAMGQGKRAAVVMFEPCEPELMYRGAEILTSLEEVRDAFGGGAV